MRSLVPIQTNGSRDAASMVPAARHLPWAPEGVFERLLDDFWGAGRSMMSRTEGALLDVTELEDSIRVCVEVPGIEPDALEISLTGQMLTLAAEKRDEHEADANQRIYSERRYGSFRRSIELPCPVDADKVTAEHRNGVVTITLLKSDAARPRRIQVRGA